MCALDVTHERTDKALLGIGRVGVILEYTRILEYTSIAKYTRIMKFISIMKYTSIMEYTMYTIHVRVRVALCSLMLNHGGPNRCSTVHSLNW